MLLASIAIWSPVSEHRASAGLPCEDHSLCNGRNKLCIARGPAWPDNFRSNEIIAQRQADRARDLLTSGSEEVSGVCPGNQLNSHVRCFRLFEGCGMGHG